MEKTITLSDDHKKAEDNTTKLKGAIKGMAKCGGTLTIKSSQEGASIPLNGRININDLESSLTIKADQPLELYFDCADGAYLPVFFTSSLSREVKLTFQNLELNGKNRVGTLLQLICTSSTTITAPSVHINNCTFKEALQLKEPIPQQKKTHPARGILAIGPFKAVKLTDTCIENISVDKKCKTKGSNATGVLFQERKKRLPGQITFKGCRVSHISNPARNLDADGIKINSPNFPENASSLLVEHCQFENNHVRSIKSQIRDNTIQNCKFKRVGIKVVGLNPPPSFTEIDLQRGSGIISKNTFIASDSDFRALIIANMDNTVEQFEFIVQDNTFQLKNINPTKRWKVWPIRIDMRDQGGNPPFWVKKAKIVENQMVSEQSSVPSNWFLASIKYNNTVPLDKQLPSCFLNNTLVNNSLAYIDNYGSEIWMVQINSYPAGSKIEVKNPEVIRVVNTHHEEC
ncbi:MAG: hypothetical protein AAFQ98_17375 [Bacteroidota bacterium]